MNTKKIGLVMLGVLLGLVVVVTNLRLPTPGGAVSVYNTQETPSEESTATASARAPVTQAPIVEESANLVSAEEQLYIDERNRLLKIREEHSSLVIGTIGGGSHPSARVSDEEMSQRIALIKQDPDKYLESWSRAVREKREQRGGWVIKAEKASQDLNSLDADGTNRFGAERIASLLARER